MNTWVILLIILTIGTIIGVLVHRRRVAKAKADGSHGGAALVSAAENIPVYGSIVKAVATVGKPVNKVINNAGIKVSEGLRHVPIAGKYLAAANDYPRQAVYKLNNWLGLA